MGKISRNCHFSPQITQTWKLSKCNSRLSLFQTSYELFYFSAESESNYANLISLFSSSSVKLTQTESLDDNADMLSCFHIFQLMRRKSFLSLLNDISTNGRLCRCEPLQAASQAARQAARGQDTGSALL